MESKQWLIIVKVERLQELQSELDRIHQEQVALVNEFVQLTAVVPDYTPSLPTGYSVGARATSNIETHGVGHSIDDSSTASYTEHNHSRQEHSNTTITSGRSHLYQE